MRAISRRPVIWFVFLVLLVTAAAPLTALPVPSKTAPDQSLADRQVDLAKIQAVVSEPQIAAALAQHGFTSEEVNDMVTVLRSGSLRIRPELEHEERRTDEVVLEPVPDQAAAEVLHVRTHDFHLAYRQRRCRHIGQHDDFIIL